MATLKVYKVSSLPPTFEPNALYFVAGPDIESFEIYISDDQGNRIRRSGKAKLHVQGIQGETLVDEVSVQAFGSVKWMLQISGVQSDAWQRSVMEIMAIHNGFDQVDATSVEYTSFAKLKTSTMDGVEISVRLTGTGNEQRMGLYVTSPNLVIDAYVTREDAIVL